MIVVEGLDNTGKTTLVEKLIKQFPELEHMKSIGNKHDLQVIRDQAHYSLMKDTGDGLFITDRSRFISEFIYNPILQQRPLAFPFTDYMDMVKDYISRPQLLIHCNLDLREIRRTMNEREQLGGVYDNLPDLSIAYDSVMNWFQWVFDKVTRNGSQLLDYDYRFDQVSEVVETVESYIKIRRS